MDFKDSHFQFTYVKLVFVSEKKDGIEVDTKELREIHYDLKLIMYDATIKNLKLLDLLYCDLFLLS